MFKKCKVVMLPTNEASYLHKDGVGLLYYLKNAYKTLMTEAHHLYFLSDEETRNEECWHYNYISNTISKEISKGHKKIIATNDTSLIQEYLPSQVAYAGIPPKKSVVNLPNKNRLPQPSQAFIERFIENYNKGNIISDVMVEYEELYLYPDGNLSKISRLAPNAKPVEQLKVDSKNTITIKKVKESWNREEMEQNLVDFVIKAFDSHNNSLSFRKHVEEMVKTYL